jgi:hypothetical protein
MIRSVALGGSVARESAPVRRSCTIPKPLIYLARVGGQFVGMSAEIAGEVRGSADRCVTTPPRGLMWLICI